MVTDIKLSMLKMTNKNRNYTLSENLRLLKPIAYILAPFIMGFLILSITFIIHVIYSIVTEIYSYFRPNNTPTRLQQNLAESFEPREQLITLIED